MAAAEAHARGLRPAALPLGGLHSLPRGVRRRCGLALSGRWRCGPHRPAQDATGRVAAPRSGADRPFAPFAAPRSGNAAAALHRLQRAHSCNPAALHSPAGGVVGS